jgi:hypothetical protein
MASNEITGNNMPNEKQEQGSGLKQLVEMFDEQEKIINQLALHVNQLTTVASRFNNAVFKFSQQVALSLQSAWRGAQLSDIKLSQYQSLVYATKQSGGDIQKTLDAFSEIRKFIQDEKNNGWLAEQKIVTRDAYNQPRDLFSLFTEISQQLAVMPQEQADALAEKLGINSDAFLSMRQGLADYQSQYQFLAGRTGYDANLAEQQTRPYLEAYNRLSQLGDILESKYGARLANSLSGPLEKLTVLILDNLPEIDNAINNTIQNIGGFVNKLVDNLPEIIKGIIAVKDAMGGWNGVFYTVLTFIAGKWVIGILGSIFKILFAIKNVRKAMSGINLLGSGRNALSHLWGKTVDIAGRDVQLLQRGWSSGKNWIQAGKNVMKSAGNYIWQLGKEGTGKAINLIKGVGDWSVRAISGGRGIITRSTPAIVGGAKSMLPFLGRFFTGIASILIPTNNTPTDAEEQLRIETPAFQAWVARTEAWKREHPNQSLPKELQDSRPASRWDGVYAQLAAQNPMNNPDKLADILNSIGLQNNSAFNGVPFPAPANNVQQTNQIYIYGAQEPKAVADSVTDAIFGNFSRMDQILRPRGIG